jgi:hypothetical protein
LSLTSIGPHKLFLNGDHLKKKSYIHIKSSWELVYH